MLRYHRSDLSPQNARVVSYLTKVGYITKYQANVVLGVARLSARIYELRRSGFPISTVLVDRVIGGKNRKVAKYILNK